jgi:hypothetical protein
MNEPLAKRIQSLKPSVGFSVAKSERVKVLQIAAIMKRAGLIKFDVVTRKDDAGNFKVRAV